MKFFEIIFILLLMIPIALLMRYFVSSLSAEKPKQRRSRPGKEEKPSIRTWYQQRKQIKEEQELETKEIEERRRPSYQPYESQPSSRLQPKPRSQHDSQSRLQYDSQPRMQDERQLRREYIPQPPGGEDKNMYGGRTRTALRRTERIPFSQMYEEQETGKEQKPAPERATRITERIPFTQMHMDQAPGQKPQPARNAQTGPEQKSGRRQKRKSRERARKRKENR